MFAGPPVASLAHPSPVSRPNYSTLAGMGSLTEWSTCHRPYLWSVVVLAVFAPFLIILSATLWRTPFPISEAVALFEDVARDSPSKFLVPDVAYYRPLFYLTLSALWYQAGSLDATLAGVRLLHIIPVVLLVVLFIWHLRPRTTLDAAAATVAVAVLVASRGFRDNLEIPLSYTIVGMPIALLVWILLTSERRAASGPIIVALTLVAIGFKEQGLVLIPLVVAACWMRAPGAGRGSAVAVATFAVVYVALRVTARSSWPPFEQAIGLGFSEMEPREAAARFGAFPFWVYAYSSAATIANVLFSEPTRGTFRIVQHLSAGDPEVWEMIHLLSSTAVTALIGWWGVRSLRSPHARWSPEARLFAATVVVLLASGVLSFNYSRDRLGGMAVVFYAIAAYYAFRAAAARALEARRSRLVLASLGLVLLAAAWQTRVIATVEIARRFAAENQAQWLVLLPDRRREYADRPVYLQIMNSMIAQGTRAGAPRPTLYPRWIGRTLGLQ